MTVNHPSLEDFEPALRRLILTAHTGGAQAVVGAGFTPRNIDDIEVNPSAHRRFLRGCHYGYDLAQRKIGTAVIDLENRMRNLKAATQVSKEHRDAALNLDRVLYARQLILRRLEDSILVSALAASHDDRAVRHLILENRIRPVDPVVLRRMLDVAHRLNRQDRMRFNVVCDLTTVARIGDLVEVDRSKPGRSTWRVIELKEGEMNEVLLREIEQKGGALSNADLDALGETLGQAAAKQAKRILAQRAREDDFESIMRSDRGISPLHKMPVSVSSELHYAGTYQETVERICQRAKKETVATSEIDGCLQLVALKRGKSRMHEMRDAAHVFYHLEHDQTECVLGDATKSRTELELINRIPLVDLVDNSFRQPTSLPLFLWANPELALELIMERLRVFVRFDAQRFFQLAAAEGITLSWVSRKESAQLKRMSAWIPGAPPGIYAARITAPDNLVDEEMRIAGGFFWRAIDYLTPPRALVRMLTTPPRRPDLVS